MFHVLYCMTRCCFDHYIAPPWQRAAAKVIHQSTVRAIAVVDLLDLIYKSHAAPWQHMFMMKAMGPR